MQETFVASNPKDAYMQAVQKYGEQHQLSLVSAKQIRHDDGSIVCEVVVSVPKETFMKHSFGSLPMVSQEEGLRTEIGELKAQLSLLQEETLQKNTQKSLLEEIKTLFMQKGISQTWLENQLKPFSSAEVMFSKEKIVSMLLEEIDNELSIEPEMLEPHIMMLVGPTGVGKTTTIAKLAARYSFLLDRPYRVVLLNLDTYKVGATEQLSSYAKMMELEYEVIETLEMFQEALLRYEHYDMILIDTAGMSPFDTQKFIETISFLKVAREKQVRVNLMLCATLKYEDMEDIYQHFSFLHIDGLLISKFDETKHFGTLLNFLLNHPLALRYFSTGQEVPHDLMCADKEYLLSSFIGDVYDA